MNYPCGITNDENIIGGQIGRPGGDIGQSCPAIWVKGSDGEYEIISYDRETLKLPMHQGTNVTGMISDGTYEGTYLGGGVACGVGSYIPFIYNRDELTLFNKLENSTIDGYRDYYFSADDVIEASFYGCDVHGYFYGSRPEVYDLKSTDPASPDYGRGKVRYHHGWYNVYTKEWSTDISGKPATAGINGEVIFLAGNRVKPDGVDCDPVAGEQFLGLDFGGRNMLGVNRTSANGNVLGFTYSNIDATGVEHAYPAIVVLDSPLVGVEGIEADASNGLVVITRRGAIEVVGAPGCAIYDMNGIRVGGDKAEGLAAGTYIVTAGKTSRKVAVK